MKYFSLFTVLIALMSATCVRAQTTDCKQFRNGKFKSTENGRTEIIERKDTVQTETVIGVEDPLPIKLPTTILLDVKWISDCSFTLILNKKFAEKYPQLPPNFRVTVTIVKTTANSYSTRTVSNMSRDTLVNEYFRAK